MESKMLRFTTVVALLGLISAATGFAAELTRVKASDIYIVGDSCVYPSSPALACGIISAVFAIITRVYITVTFGGCSCCRNDPNSTPISKLLYVFSWVSSVMALVLLLAAGGLKEGGEVDSYGYVTCYVVKSGIFASGAVLALLSAVFGIAAYVILSNSGIQTTVSSPPFGFHEDGNVDLEKSPMSCSTQQSTPQKNYT